MCLLVDLHDSPLAPTHVDILTVSHSEPQTQWGLHIVRAAAAGRSVHTLGWVQDTAAAPELDYKTDD